MQLVDKQEGSVGDALKLTETYPNKVGRSVLDRGGGGDDAMRRM